MAAAIRLEDVTFRFWEEGKRNILDHASLTIEEGGITVLMGASGCGKSTLAAVAAGLYPENGGYLEGGSIRLYGHDLKDMDPAARAGYLTVMFQNPDLQFCMDTLRREMIFCLENISVPVAEMDRRIAETAERLHMTALLDRPLTSLSGGEKQKATLCCLCVMESRCILLDEPFANIDPDAAEELVDLLLEMKAAGRTIVAIDHQPEYWLRAADEFILLGAGGAVAARGIRRDNLAAFRGVFEEQGVFFPSERAERRPAPAEGEAAISLEKVSIPVAMPKKRLFRRDTEAPVWLLKDADAVFPKGRMTAILGRSGCGKTTTFLSILKQHPYTGRILLEGRDIAGIPQRELYRQVGIVFQNPANQFITQNVEEEVRAGIRVWEPQLGDAPLKERAERLLEGYGLLPQRRYSPYMLSQGQQRRLAVLSVLAGRQRILFLDEPTYGQDQRSTRAIMTQLREKMAHEGLTVVFITHDRRLAAEWADKVYLFEERKLKEAVL